MAYLNKQDILNKCRDRLGMFDYAVQARYEWDEYGKYYERILDSLYTIEQSDIFSENLRNIALTLRDNMMTDAPVALYELVDQMYQFMDLN
jgi:hypothetical protein